MKSCIDFNAKKVSNERRDLTLRSLLFIGLWLAYFKAHQKK